SSRTTLPDESPSGTFRFGYSWSVPGWFCERRSPTASARETPTSADGAVRTRRGGASTSSRSDGSAPTSPRWRRTATMASRPAGPRRAALREDAGAVARREVRTGEVAGRGRQVVRRDGREREGAAVLGRQRGAAGGPLGPRHRGAEHAAVGEVVAHPGLLDAE